MCGVLGGESGRRSAAGLKGGHQTQQEGAAAAGQALQGREAPSANGGEWGSKKCERDAVEGGADAVKWSKTRKRARV